MKSLFKNLLLVFSLVFLVFSFNGTNAQSLENSALVTQNINTEAKEELIKLYTNFFIFANDNQFIEPWLVVNQYNKIRYDCGTIAESIMKNTPALKISPEFLKYCTTQEWGSADVEKMLNDKNFLSNLHNLNNIFSIWGGDAAWQIKAVEETARIISTIRTSNTLMMENFQNATFVEPSNEAEFNITKFLMPTSNKKTLICVLTSPEGTKGSCDPKAPHYKVFFGLIFNDIYLDEGTLFLNVGNAVLLNPIITIGIFMYNLVNVFFLLFFAFKLFDIIFPNIKDGTKIERKFILSISNDYSISMLLKELIISDNSTFIANEYRMPGFLSIFNNNQKISWLTHWMLFVVIYLVFVGLSTYLL